MKKSEEFQRFDHNMEELLKVPHSQIKKKLDEEKAARAERKKKHKTSSKAGRE